MANMGSSFRKVPERSIAGMGSCSSRLFILLLVFIFVVCFCCLHNLGVSSFATFGTILAELDFVALIKEPDIFLSHTRALILAECVHTCPFMLVFDLPLPLHDTEFWLEYTGIFVFTLAVSSDDGDKS